MSKKKIAIFASGSGTNAEQIIKHFQHHDQVEVALILSNKKDAYVLQRAANHNVPTNVFGRKDFYETENVNVLLLAMEIDYVVLAGFLWLVPPYLIKSFANRIINIHPALLPNYGGKGMFGDRVHEAVIANKERESGITIHLVDEIYDNGKILRQEKCQITSSDTAETLAKKIHQLEYKYFPVTIEIYIMKTG